MLYNPFHFENENTCRQTMTNQNCSELKAQRCTLEHLEAKGERMLATRTRPNTTRAAATGRVTSQFDPLDWSTQPKPSA